MSINDDILSRELKHRALLSLYEKKLDNGLTKVMSSHKKRLVNSTLKNGLKGSNTLNRALGIETRKTYRTIYRQGLKDLKALAKVDAAFQAGTLKQALGKIYRAKVYTGLKVNDLIINSAGTYSQQITSISLNQQRKIKNIVKDGLSKNLNVNQIAKNIGQSVELPTAQLKTLSRTAITETSTTVNQATYKLNEDVLDGYQYVATLDGRTSLICARLDGKVFRLSDKRGVRPPQHFNCRSTTIPIVKSRDDLLNTNSSRISKRRLSRLSKGKRASINGQVPAKTTYDKWLRTQDNVTKLAILGTQKRVDIFNTGKLALSKFSNAQGQLVSIKTLETLLGPKSKATAIRTTVKAVTAKTTQVVNTPTKKLSSLKDPLTDEKLYSPGAFISEKEYTQRLKALTASAHTDPRYPKGKYRFQGEQSMAGDFTSVPLDLIERKTVAHLFDEVNDIADLYKVPRLRGLQVMYDAEFSGSMGGGVLRINRSWLREILNDFAEYEDLYEFSDWKMGDLLKNLPRSASAYTDTAVERVKHTFYHEMGHHIHQSIGLNPNIYGPKTVPPVEIALKNAKLNFRKKANSTYGQTNEREWFAEQFASYHMGKLDKVHPDFIKIIKDIKNGKYNR